MRRFAALYAAIDATTSTNDKVDAMVAYFRAAPPADAAWATFFLTGGRFKRLLPTRLLVEWTLESARLPGWILEDCYAEVGDLAEIIALLVGEAPVGAPPVGAGVSPALPAPAGHSLHHWCEDEILPLRDLDPDAQRQRVLGWWTGLDRDRLFVLCKLLTGELRVGVSRTLVVRALARVAGVDDAVVAHRLMGAWQPTADAFEQLIARETSDADRSRPYPFFLATALDLPPEQLGDVTDWQAEWKWDGIRAQLVHRGGSTWIWSRGEELVTDRFPEVAEMAEALPDVVLDGEIMAWRHGPGAGTPAEGSGPLPFNVLQTRIGRTKVSKKALETAPVAFVAYDLLEADGQDWRERPLAERRERLEQVVAATSAAALQLSPIVTAESWTALAALRETARERGVEGLMLKHRASAYRTGRRRGEWWKWKIDPYSVDAVLIYAQPGHGRRASLYTDYTFAVWRGGELVPFAKAYSGLDQAEIEELDRWIRRHTVERFGPVRRVAPEHVFELHFEGIQRSTRHKSGVAVRFPRIARWRRDKSPDAANTLDDVIALADLGRSGDQATKD